MFESGNKNEPYELFDGFNSRTVYCIVDCTTITNFRGLLNKIIEISLSYTHDQIQ